MPHTDSARFVPIRVGASLNGRMGHRHSDQNNKKLGLTTAIRGASSSTVIGMQRSAIVVHLFMLQLGHIPYLSSPGCCVKSMLQPPVASDVVSLSSSKGGISPDFLNSGRVSFALRRNILSVVGMLCLFPGFVSCCVS